MQKKEMIPKILVIIPAFNEEDNLVNVVDNIITKYPDYDYVVINDGSKDNTRKICIDKQYNYVDYPLNQGLTSAFRGGLYYALKKKYDYIIQCDADGQHKPEYIENMLNIAIEKNVDIVIGSRFVNERKPFSFRMLGSRIISFCILLTAHKRIKDPTSGMRLFNRRSIELIYSQKDFGPEPDAVAHLLRSGMKVVELPVEISERMAGSSYLNVTNSIKYMLHMCFSIIIVEHFRRRG